MCMCSVGRGGRSGRGAKGGKGVDAKESAPENLDDQMTGYFASTEHGMTSQLDESVTLILLDHHTCNRPRARTLPWQSLRAVVLTTRRR